MARNFRLSKKTYGNRSVALKLFGDFDGSSACELMNVLDKAIPEFKKVAIDTDGLRAIHAFGLDIFLPRMSGLKNAYAKIDITGRFREVFQGE